MAVNRRARDEAYAVLLDYVWGHIGAGCIWGLDEFSGKGDTDDPGVDETLGIVSWDMFREISDEDERARFYRVLLFLKSDYAYRWPLNPEKTLPDRLRLWYWGCGCMPLIMAVFAAIRFRPDVLLAIVPFVLVDRLLKRWDDRVQAKRRDSGDYDLWPFFSREEWEQALAECGAVVDTDVTGHLERGQ